MSLDQVHIFWNADKTLTIGKGNSGLEPIIIKAISDYGPVSAFNYLESYLTFTFTFIGKHQSEEYACKERKFKRVALNESFELQDDHGGGKWSLRFFHVLSATKTYETENFAEFIKHLREATHRTGIRAEMFRTDIPDTRFDKAVPKRLDISRF